MAPGMLGKVFAPVGLVLILVGVLTAALAFLLILLDISGDFPNRIRALAGTTALALIIGGAALTWLGKSGGS